MRQLRVLRQQEERPGHRVRGGLVAGGEGDRDLADQVLVAHPEVALRLAATSIETRSLPTAPAARFSSSIAWISRSIASARRKRARYGSPGHRASGPDGRREAGESQSPIISPRRWERCGSSRAKRMSLAISSVSLRISRQR